MMRLLLLAAAAACARAACSNQCSGHGLCDKTDSCVCSPRWSGPDCSQRDCPKGKSWVWSDASETKGAGMGSIGASHAYTTCSSKGSCDSETGECACFPGYTGLACNRQACPDQCSGHGRCVYNSRVNSGLVQKFESQHWDADMTRQCKCDRGWQGYACTERMCPRGNDPLRCTTADEKTDQMSIQIIDVLIPDGTTNVGTWSTHMKLTFTDMFNGVYTTQPIYLDGSAPSGFDGSAAWPVTEQFKKGTCCGCGHEGTGNPWAGGCTADNEADCATANKCWVEEDLDSNRIRAALEALPNFAIPKVNVTRYTTDNSLGWNRPKCPDGTVTNGQCPGDHTAYQDDGWSFAVTFSDPATSGPQKLMTCELSSGATNFAAVSPRMEVGACPSGSGSSDEAGCEWKKTKHRCVWKADTSTCELQSGDTAVNENTGVVEGTACSQHDGNGEILCHSQIYYTLETNAFYAKGHCGPKDAFAVAGMDSCSGLNFDSCEENPKFIGITMDTSHPSVECTGTCTGSGAVLSLTLTSGASTSYSSFNTEVAGSSYVDDDAWKVLGSALGGVDATNDLTVDSDGTDLSSATIGGTQAAHTGGTYQTSTCNTLCRVRTADRTDTEYNVATVTPSKAGTVCSSRGLCDSQTGLCNCFDGYAGEACAFQTIFF